MSDVRQRNVKSLENPENLENLENPKNVVPKKSSKKSSKKLYPTHSLAGYKSAAKSIYKDNKLFFLVMTCMALAFYSVFS